MMRISCVFAVLVLAIVGIVVSQEPFDCSYPCPATFVAAQVCGHSAKTDQYFLFRTDCVLDCYNKLHPETSFVQIGETNQSCASQGHKEEQNIHEALRDLPN